MRFARRFATVGAIVTLVDIGLVLLWTWRTDWHPALVDALAIVVANVVSYLLHRAISYAAEPARRWYRDLRHYLVASFLALAVDVSVFTLLVRTVSPTVGQAVLPKLVALFVAFLVRLAFYRETMFRQVRADQSRPADRPPAPGDVRLSLVIPAYFEEDGIADTVRRVEDALGHLRADGVVLQLRRGHDDVRRAGWGFRARSAGSTASASPGA